MKIGIVSDTHFGYLRFYEDGLKQGREAIINALERSDILIHAGDMFDTRLPNFETLERVIGIWKEAGTFKKPIIAIHGNHERRIKGYINPVKLIATTGIIKYLHGDVASYEIGGERINVLGIGSVPEEHSKIIIEKAIEKNREKLKDGKNILIIHQMIKEFDPTQSTELSLAYLESLDFELIINGHIHKKYLEKNSKLLIPGSTVVTALDETETSHKRGFVIYDTKTKEKEFKEIPQREIFVKILEFDGEGYEEVYQKVEKSFKELKEKNKDAIVKIVLKGKIKEGLNSSLVKTPEYPELYVKNNLVGSLKEGLEEAKKYFNYENVNAWAEEQIIKKLSGKTKINPEKLLAILYESEDIDKTVEMMLNEEED